MREIKKILRLFFSSPFSVLLLILFVLLGIINLRFTDIGFLSLANLDEYAFHGSLLTMFDGLHELNLKKLFGFGFFTYGFGFFFINLLVTSPFLHNPDSSISIYLPRILSSIGALFGLFYLYRTSRINLSRLSSCLIALIAVSMPAFWINASIFHPDWLMTACLLAALYNFVRNDENPGKNYWYGIIWFGLAISLGKFQAFTFLPFLLFYLFRNEIVQLNFSQFFSNLKQAVISIISLVLLFILFNPYLLNPSGLRAFLGMMDINMRSNATGHGLTVKYTIVHKLFYVIFENYLNPLLFIILISIIFYWCIDYFRSVKHKSYHSLAFYCLIYLSYLLFFVNKDWQAYYLGLIIPSLLLTIPLIVRLQPTWQITILIAGLLTQVIFNFKEYSDIACRAKTKEIILKQQVISNFIVQNIKTKVKSNSTVLISPSTGFSFNNLGLNYRNIYVLYSPLSYEMIDLKAFLRKYNFTDLQKFKFRKMDFIILRKDDIYFNSTALQKRYDRAAFDTAIVIIKKLETGNIGYSKIGENKDVIIFERAKP